MARSDLADAFLARLRAAPGATLPVYDGAVPNSTPLPKPPYLVAYFRFLTRDGERAPDMVDVEDRSQPVEMRAYIHAAGGNAKASREVADRAYAQLFGWTPAVGWGECWPVRHEDSRPPDRDESSGLVVVAVDVYRVTVIPI
ncbi:MAG TPA: hypothetical protein VFX60_19365 [Micromonospora sp.]|nr:hypothetical protein [Micromonospora sp.]